MAYQREYFFYLIAAKTNSDYLMDTSNKYAGNVAPLEWIRVILSICESASVVISENGCFGSAIDGQRARVLIVLRNGFVFKFCGFDLLFILEQSIHLIQPKLSVDFFMVLRR